MPRAKPSTAKSFLCPKPGCKVSLSSMTGLNRHVRAHDNPERFPCDWEGCGKSFTQKGNLGTHIKSVHFKMRSPPCGVHCDHTFSSMSNLWHHYNALKLFPPERKSLELVLGKNKTKKARRGKKILEFTKTEEPVVELMSITAFEVAEPSIQESADATKMYTLPPIDVSHNHVNHHQQHTDPSHHLAPIYQQNIAFQDSLPPSIAHWQYQYPPTNCATSFTPALQPQYYSGTNNYAAVTNAYYVPTTNYSTASNAYSPAQAEADFLQFLSSSPGASTSSAQTSQWQTPVDQYVELPEVFNQVDSFGYPLLAVNGACSTYASEFETYASLNAHGVVPGWEAQPEQFSPF